MVWPGVVKRVSSLSSCLIYMFCEGDSCGDVRV